MREDNLLAVQPRQFVTTTDSEHALEIYLNLAWRMKLTGIDQLWVADITYIRLQAEFVYLAVVLDGYSRKVVGWKLDRTLASRLAIEALERRSPRDSRRRPGASLGSRRSVRLGGIRRHPDRSRHGSQHEPAGQSVRQRQLRELHQDPEAGGDLRERLLDLEHLRDQVEEFIERYYNQQRLHSALGYCTPHEFEQKSGGAGEAELHSPTVVFWPRTAQILPTGMLEEGTQTPSLPQTPSLLLVNQRVILLAAAGGHLMSRKALKPIAILTSETRRISEGNLDIRLPVPGPTAYPTTSHGRSACGRR